jgi:hypothetical protein
MNIRLTRLLLVTLDWIDLVSQLGSRAKDGFSFTVTLILRPSQVSKILDSGVAVT